MALLLIDVLRDNRDKSRFALHEYVVMPNHVHLLFTPSPENPLEKCAQFIKGGFSFRAKKELNFKGEVWQSSFTQRRIEDPQDYLNHALYIRNNPVRAGIVKSAAEFAYSSANAAIVLDPAPKHLQG